MKKKSYLIVFLLFLFTNLFAAENKSRYVSISIDMGDSVTESEASWLKDALLNKFKVNFAKYTDFVIVNREKQDFIYEMQKESETASFDESTAIEFSKVKHENYKIFVTLNRNENDDYVLYVDVTNLTTGVSEANVISKPRKNIENLYSGNGSSIDEITIELCVQLGIFLPASDKYFIMYGEVGMSNLDKKSIYDSEVRFRTELLEKLKQEEKDIEFSTELTDFVEQERIKAEKALAEEKLKIAKENQERIQQEILRRETYNEKYSDQKDKLNKVSEEMNSKVKELRDAKEDNQSLLGKISLIELRKKAIIDINNSLEKEMGDMVASVLEEIKDTEEKIVNSPYRKGELLSDGITPSPSAIDLRKTAYIKEKEKLIENCTNDVENINEKLNDQKKALYNEIYKDYKTLKNKTISTLGNELFVSYGEYDAEKYGWNLDVTVKSDDIEIFNTTSFLPFKTLTGKDPKSYMEDDPIAFYDDIDFYDGLLLSGEPVLVYELKYNVYPFKEKEPSKYKFKFSNFYCYDTKTLKLKKDKLSSSRSGKLKLETDEIVREMPILYDLRDTIKDNPTFEELVQKRLSQELKSEFLANLTYAPEVFSQNTDGSAGEDGVYILLGDWPQKLKSEYVEIDENVSFLYHNYECFKGSDGFFYLKNEKSYYRIDPIKWRVLTDELGGNSLLVAEDILAACRFVADKKPRIIDGENINDYEYKFSNVRAYLNSFDGSNYKLPNYRNKGFLDFAFSMETQKLLQETFIDGSGDKVFIIDDNDIFNSEYYSSSTDINKNRVKRGTDFAKDVLLYQDNMGWITRSAENKEYSHVVKENGSVYTFKGGYDYEGLAPAIILSNKDIGALIPPKDVSNVAVDVIDGKLNLTWTNPDCEFSKILIKGDSFKSMELSSKRGMRVTKDIVNISNNQKVSLNIQVIDKAGLKSPGINLEPSFTLKPIKLKKRTDGSYGTNGHYVLFGDWPQSLKKDDVTIDTKHKIILNNWECYKGSDGCYYVEQIAKVNKKNAVIGKTKIINNKSYYFKIEPIKWGILSDIYMSGRFLLAENILDFSTFCNFNSERNINGKKIYSNNYEYSNARAYLNGLDGSNYNIADYKGKGFIDKAFTTDARKIINNSVVDNSAVTTRDDYNVIGGATKYVSNDTKDKILLPSLKEVTKKAFDFKGYNVADGTRNRKPTDFVSLKSFENQESNSSSWSTRSPGNYDKSYLNYIVDIDSKVKGNNVAAHTGILPAIVVSQNYLSTSFYPDDVYNIKVTGGKNKLNITWTNSSAYNIVKVILYCSELPTGRVEVKCKAGETVTQTLYGLKSNYKHTIKLQAVDSYGRVSDGITIEPKITSIPETLARNTTGTCGRNAEYILFGDWPQTIKRDSVKVDLENVITINGWPCYKGSDGCYYVKQVATNENSNYSKKLFSNGTKMIAGNAYYFKLEPIKWCVYGYDESTNKKLLTENILVGSSFFTSRGERATNSGITIYANNYEYSYIRNFLNSYNGTKLGTVNLEGLGFLDRAFSSEVQNTLCSMTVDNAKPRFFSSGKYYCNNTIDRATVLSVTECYDSLYFSDKNEGDIYRVKTATDFARIQGVFVKDMKGAASWWLRSPNRKGGQYASIVGTDGKIYYDDVTYMYGVAPAITLYK